MSLRTYEIRLNSTEMELLVGALGNLVDDSMKAGRPDYADGARGLRRALIALAPAKPDEPTGLGAVVKDRQGHVWCRIHESYGDFLWRMEVPNTAAEKYADIDAVEVLSPGVVTP